jgi:hypothetical protein
LRKGGEFEVEARTSNSSGNRSVAAHFVLRDGLRQSGVGAVAGDETRG